MTPSRALLQVFDEVHVLRGGRWERIPIEEFFAMPLNTRVRRIIERSVAFYRQGEEVDRKEALAALRKLRAG